MLAAGQIIPLTIEKPAAGGRMIARADGQVVLVSGAIPGEQVMTRIERIGRGVAYGVVQSIDVASSDRRAVAMDPLCGGCAYVHIAYPRQLELKGLVIQDALTRIGRLDPPAPITVAASPEHGYRMRARLHIRESRVGFFREGTHDVCDARATRQLRDDTSDALDRLIAGLRSLGMAGIRELEVSENLDASERVVHLEGTATIAPRALSSLGLSDGLTGLTVSTPQGHGRVAVVKGSPHVVDALNVGETRIQLRRHVLAFFQGNRYLLPSLVSHVVSHVGADDRVIDLYAGTGLFSVAAAAARGAHVIAVEGDPSGATDLAFNAEPLKDRLRAIHQSVETFVEQTHERPTVLIVDPPRTGMTREALTGAIALRARTVVYVSCDVATLARDSRLMADAGYSLDRVTGFDLFPNTPHVETVASFSLR